MLFNELHASVFIPKEKQAGFDYFVAFTLLIEIRIFFLNVVLSLPYLLSEVSVHGYLSNWNLVHQHDWTVWFLIADVTSREEAAVPSTLPPPVEVRHTP